MSDGTVELNEAMDRVERGMSAMWRLYAEDALEWCMNNHVSFTSDEIWAYLDETGAERPREPRCMGVITQKALRDGIIEEIGFRKSTMASCHKRPKALYRKVMP